MKALAFVPAKIMRLRDLRTAPYGHVWMVTCQHCQHIRPLPLSGMLRQNSELTPLQHVIEELTCPQCKKQAQAKAILVAVTKSN